jgi:hypothetical protein
MTNRIVLTQLSAYSALQYKQQLSHDGLINDQDYTWRYQPVKYNNEWSTIPIEQSQVVFEFNSPALASFYRVKWAK